MADLGISGVQSLRALSDWISFIGTNVTQANRVGFKETRISMELGNPTVIGAERNSLAREISIPSTQLTISNSKIMDQEQGLLMKTEEIAHMGLSGKGYFVVEDENGEKYATRDGEFKFDNSGYLVNAQGLKVLSVGQDYIRAPKMDNFYMDFDGISDALTTYGDKQLMVINLPITENLYYSRFGYTSFELGKYVPVTLDNDFSKTVDGFNPYLVDSTDSYGVNGSYIHNKRNSTVDIDFSKGHTTGLVSSHRFIDFRNHVRFRINDSLNADSVVNQMNALPVSTSFALPVPAANTFSSYGFSFGQDEIGDTVTNSGYGAGVVGTDLQIFDSAGNVLATTALGALADNVEYELSLIVESGLATVGIRQVRDAAGVINGGTVFSVSANVRADEYRNGYQSLGSFDNRGLASEGLISMTQLHVKEVNKNTAYEQLIVGGTADDLDTNIQQQHLEQSTATLSDSVTMLSNAQKIFGAVSKIINVSNARIDDMNNLIR